MLSFQELSARFEEKFNQRLFPAEPPALYDAAHYILDLGGKRIRPLLCLMGNELFNDISPDAYHVATAIELFHNFTLLHDDIMDKAPLRRGKPTVHKRFNESTALLAGDVMLVKAYEYLNKVDTLYIHRIMDIFNKMAREVCEGQQLDMVLEQRDSLSMENNVSMNEYLQMITLKTSVLLGAALQCGAILGGAGRGNQELVYNFGKNLGIAFQVQDDYLDAFGDPEKFGKQPGGDILANKKTFLLIRVLDTADKNQKKALLEMMDQNGEEKVSKVLQIYRDCKVEEWAVDLKKEYMGHALNDLEEIAVLSVRKNRLRELAEFLLNRDM